MQLSNTRYIRIDGRQVHVLASDTPQARVALKELRHKKRELLHYRRRLRRRKKAIETRNAYENRTGTSPEMSFVAYVLRALGAVIALVIGWNPFLPATLPRTLDAVNEDLNTLEDVLININEAMLHVQGKLASE